MIVTVILLCKIKLFFYAVHSFVVNKLYWNLTLNSQCPHNVIV